MKKLIWLSCFSYLLIGLTHIMLGSLLAEILDYYGKSYTSGGILVACQSVGFLAGVLASSYLARYGSKRQILLVSVLTIGLSQTVFVFLPPWEWWFVFAVTSGLGFGIIEPLVGSLVIDAAKNNKAVLFTRLEVFFGLGSLVMPLISGWLATTGFWRFSFLVLGLYAFSIAFFWAKSSFGELNPFLDEKNSQTEEQKGMQVPAKRNSYILTGFIVFFLVYVGAEISIMNFLPSIFLSSLPVDTLEATVSVTWFWGAMVAGRLAAGYLAERMGYFRYLAACCLGMVLFTAALGFIPQLWIGYAVVVLLGLMMAGIFGIALVYATDLLPGQTHGNTSILIAAGGAGGILLPLLTGKLMDEAPVAFVLVTLAGLASFLFLFIVLLQGAKKKMKWS